jgi:hypothetical protein
MPEHRHGGPYDRGSADSYYGRGIDPHYYVGNTGTSERIPAELMTPEELEEYMCGYWDNEEERNYKDWG